MKKHMAQIRWIPALHPRRLLAWLTGFKLRRESRTRRLRKALDHMREIADTGGAAAPVA